MTYNNFISDETATIGKRLKQSDVSEWGLGLLHLSRKKIGIKEKARQNVTKTVQKYTLHRAVVAVRFECVQELRRVSHLTIYKRLWEKITFLTCKQNKQTGTKKRSGVLPAAGSWKTTFRSIWHLASAGGAGDVFVLLGEFLKEGKQTLAHVRISS